MHDPLPLWLEHDGDFATLYVRGALDHERRASMLDLCASLPPSVRTLRLDLRAIGAMSHEATDAVRMLLAHWHATRGGACRLSTSHLVATCTSAHAPVVHSSAMMPTEAAALALA